MVYYVTSLVVTSYVIITYVKERRRDYQTVGQHNQQRLVSVTAHIYTRDLSVTLWCDIIVA